MSRTVAAIRSRLVCVFTGAVLAAPLLSAQTDEAVYTDALSNGWQNYGWTQIDYASTNFVHSGSKAIAVTITNNSYQAIYIDDISLAGAAPSIVIDALRNRHSISPFIYGTAFASSTQLADLNSPLNRSGGNAETRYNWQINAHN